MKKTILSFLVILSAFMSQAQENWITFQDYPTFVDIDLKQTVETHDTPFVLKNRQGVASNYLLPVKFTPETQHELTDINIKIKSIGASYDTKDRLMIYFRGKIDMSCCYPAPISIDLLDDEGNLIQKTKTDEFGNFKIKSIDGNIIDISKGKIKFNFSKIKTFDANADTRFALLEIYNKPIDTELLNSETTVLNSNN